MSEFSTVNEHAFGIANVECEAIRPKVAVPYSIHVAI